ncbi:hypothetical protein PIB30_061123 [Stylosanthes scabra]|uniref:Peptidase A1 domain-containing protein n=1 Tax=Stylosanthes scabra TaxID=79078 RepID=A0ABU6ZJG2_9FABA|nr:hypothetical protein [Stylosanthes scabra]
MASRISSCDVSSLVYTLLLLFLLTIPNATNGFKLKLIPRTEIDSFLFPKNLSLLETHKRLVQLTRTRSLSFNQITPENLKPRVTNVLTSVYVVQMLIGTDPSFSTFLLMDSGSDDTWIQCDGCVNCFPLGGGSFKYRASKTYKAVSCNHPLCIPKLCSPQGLCLYSIRYGYNAFSGGIVSAENFTFPDTVEDSISFQNVVFGCGFDNQNIQFGAPLGEHNFIAGIIGLGAGSRSILSQLSASTNLRFSYCFTPYSSPAPYSYLWFGEDARINGDFKTTPLVERGIPRYYVNLKKISLNDIELPIDPLLFALRDDLSGGFAFDTGSGQTTLVNSAYQVLKLFVDSHFSEFGMDPITDRELPYDLCYHVPSAGKEYSRPSMTYHFDGDGADLVVDGSQVFQDFDDIFCLIVLPRSNDEGPSLLGSYQMVGYRFLTDVRQKTISFVPEMCSNA